jgi:hypothetical protein
MGSKDVFWIELTQDDILWRDLVNTSTGSEFLHELTE